MKILFCAVWVYFYGLYADYINHRFNRLVIEAYCNSMPLTSARLVSLSQKSYLKSRKFSDMAEKLNLEIAKRRSL